MFETQEPNRSVTALDLETIQAGNRGLSIDREAVTRKVADTLAKMTLAQKLNEIHGLQPAPIDGLYHAGGDGSLDIPVFKMVDGPRGARAGFATAFPVAMARGATFDAELEKRVGLAAGMEVAAKSGNVILAPTINLLRHPGWGRAQETYSEDPYHMGIMGLSFVCGAQNHVLASPKHFALNNLEMTRFETSANIDRRTLHEVYLPHFRRCVVEGGASSVMSAYNKMNGVYCGEHPALLDEILRHDWGFEGFVESDWFLGTRSTADALNAGMDIEMPAPYRYSEENIVAAIASGDLSEAVIDRSVARALYMKYAWDLETLPVPDETVVECAEHIALAREVAEKSFVLLKNEGVLPLQDGMRIAVVGDLADTVNLGDRGSSFVSSSEVTTPLAGMRAFGNSATIAYFGSDADLSGLDQFDVAVVVTGLTYKEEGEFIPTQQEEAEGSDLARGGDRADLRLPEKEETLVQSVARHAKQTVVLLEAGSAVEVTPWVEDVDALMMIWYPGREGGHAVARVLFGEVNPSGKLPLSMPRSMNQLMEWDIQAMDIPHDLYHGYRYLDQKNETPLYAFGYGLSYTSFSVDGLQVERDEFGFDVTVTITNSGDRRGATVGQLYIGVEDSSVERVLKELKGFGRIELDAGESADLVIRLPDDELRYYDPDQGWTLEACSYNLMLGLSSDDLPLSSSWRYDGEDWEPV